MKKLVLLFALVAFTMIARAQSVTYTFYVDTIHGVYGVDYLNTLESIEQYHESDDFVARSQPDGDGAYKIIFLNETNEPTLYVYFMTGNMCDRLDVYTDKKMIQDTKKLIRMMQQ